MNSGNVQMHNAPVHRTLKASRICSSLPTLQRRFPLRSVFLEN